MKIEEAIKHKQNAIKGEMQIDDLHELEYYKTEHFKLAERLYNERKTPKRPINDFRCPWCFQIVASVSGKHVKKCKFCGQFLDWG